MGTITRLNGSNLYWLGRYTERVFTTLNSFFRYFDRMIDQDELSYQEFLDALGAPDIYTDSHDFINRFVFDPKDCCSIRTSFDRALDNGICSSLLTVFRHVPAQTKSVLTCCRYATRFTLFGAALKTT